MAAVASPSVALMPDAAGPVAAPGWVPPAQAATSPTSPTQKELQARAEDYVRQEKFNRRLTLPATAKHGELVVSYALAGADSESAPGALFIGGLYGGRFLATIADHAAKKLGMRVVVIDRPGMGHSTPVDPSLRLSVWLETVPVLMRTLGVQHLALLAHSCGVIYALNTLHAMPGILPPSNRKLYLLAPWVTPDHSGVTMLSISSHLPSPLINSFDGIVRFVKSAMVPTWQFSGMVSGVVSAPFIAAFGDDVEDGGENTPKHQREDLCRRYLGVSAAESAARGQALTNAIFAESTRGANHEALLLLRKEAAGPWGACDNYEAYPEILVERLKDLHRQERAQRAESAQSTGPAGNGDEAVESPLRQPFAVQVFWAEADILIENKGKEYFDSCFQRYAHDEHSSGEDADRVLVYESETIPNTNHDSLCLPQYGALPRVLAEMMGRSEWED